MLVAPPDANDVTWRMAECNAHNPTAAFAGRGVEGNPVTKSAVIGKWRIFEADDYAARDLDLVEPAFIQFNADGAGQFKFICVDGAMECGYSANGADFDWVGVDEMDEVSGSGHADLGEAGILTITISRFKGHEATFSARRW